MSLKFHNSLNFILNVHIISNFNIYYGVGIINRVCRCDRVVWLPQKKKITASEIVDDDIC